MLRCICLTLLLPALLVSGDALGKDPTVVEYGYVRILDARPSVLFLTRSPEPDPGPQYTRCLLEGDGVRDYAGRFCRVEGVLVEGTLVPRTLVVDRIALAPEVAYRQPILDDLKARGVDFHEDGTDRPAGGLDRDGTCPDGSEAIPLYLVAPNGNDVFVIEAWICHGCGCYWALRSGGFAGVIEWVGPYPLPGADYTPDRVKPGKLRAGKKPRTRTLSICLGKGSLPVYGMETFTPDDIDMGEGITVLEVLGSKKRRIRVRVEIAADAAAGPRDVSVKGDTAEGLLEVRRRRR